MNTAASGTTGVQLAHDRVDRYRSLGAFGKPAYQSHVQLRAMLKSKRGDRIANYFARPTYDPDLGELRWTAEVPGAARGWHEMSGEEQALGALELEVIRSGLMSFAQELRAQSAGQPGGAASFASLLDQATRVPADGSFLYFVGDQPVIAFWGFEDQSGRSIDPATPAPKYAAAPVAQAAAAAMPVDSADRDKRAASWRWLRWLLWALLLLALLALLFVGLRACAPSLGLSVPGLTDEPRRPEVMSPTSPNQPEHSLPRADLDGRSIPGSGADGSKALPTEPVAPYVAPSAEPPAASPAPGGEPPTAPETEPSELPDATPSTPDTNSDSSPPADTRKPPAVEPPRAASPKDHPMPLPKGGQANPPMRGQAMALPDQPDAARKLKFLEGKWKAGDGLVDKKTKQPVDLGFKFNKDGKGELTMRRPDGTKCTGAVTGRMDGGKLRIRGAKSVPCSNGGSYGPPKIECEKESAGRTQCFGINADGSRYFMGMQRQ